MYVKNIVICDCEKQYAKNLLQIFSGKKVAGIRLYLFDTVEEAAEFSEKETIHVLLIAGEYFQKLESPIPAKTCFLLTRELSEKAGAGGRGNLSLPKCGSDLESYDGGRKAVYR